MKRTIDNKEEPMPFDILIEDKSQIDIDKTIFQKLIIKTIINSNFNKADTSLLSNNLTSSSDMRDVAVPMEQKSMDCICSMLADEEYESGIANPSENAFLNMMIRSKISAMNSLTRAFMDNFSLDGKKINILVGILHMLSHFPYNDVYPNGQVIAISALTHKNREVAEYGIKCFENWQHVNGIEKLRAIRFSTQWLQEYANQVIYELEKGE